MPVSVSKMTATTFVMRLAVAERSAIDVTVTGTGFTYDARTGAILSGDVTDMVLTSLNQSGRFWAVSEVRQLNGIDTRAEVLAEMFGTRFWNEARLVVEAFEKFADLHDGISTSTFSKTSNSTRATDHSDRISGYKWADSLHGGAGDDDLYGAGGRDTIDGGRGDDFLSGGIDRDFLTDHEGNNTLQGDSGNDTLIAGDGIDVLFGGSGRDVMFSGGGYDRMAGGTGNDAFIFSAKIAGKLTITDFAEGDLLVDLTAGSADEAYRHFRDTARQDGRHLVIEQDELTLVLRNTRLESLEVDDFSGAAGYGDLPLF